MIIPILALAWQLIRPYLFRSQNQEQRSQNQEERLQNQEERLQNHEERLQNQEYT